MSDVLVHQGSATSDGFLSSTEYSLWASTMRLEEDEAHPTLEKSHFMTLPTALPPQVSFFICLFNPFSLRSEDYQTMDNMKINPSHSEASIHIHPMTPTDNISLDLSIMK